MSIVRITRWTELLSRLSGNFGASTGASLIDDVMPVLSVEDLQPESLKLANQHRGFVTATQGAIAAQFSSVALLNLPGSSRLVIVERLQSTNDVNLGLRVGGVGALWTVLLSLCHPADGRDARMSSTTGAFGRVAAGAITTGSDWALRINDLLDVPFVLPPDSALYLESPLANTPVTAKFFVREREIEPAER